MSPLPAHLLARLIVLTTLALTLPAIAAAQGGGRGGRGGRAVVMDSARARQLYVSTRPEDHPQADFERQIAQRLVAESTTVAKSKGVLAYRTVSYKSSADGMEIPASLYEPLQKRGPRGHAAMVGAIMTDSSQADFGAFFISSYVYLDMCGHATIGLARTLAATGQVDVERGPAFFSLETPAGIVRVDVDKAASGAVSASIRNVPAYVEIPELTVDVEGIGPVELAVAYCGGRFALVDTAQRNWTIEPDRANELCRVGAAIKDAVNREIEEPVGSVLFFSDDGRGRARHLVVLESNKFDRSPCGTGTSARLAALHASGALDVGEPGAGGAQPGGDAVAQRQGKAAVDGAQGLGSEQLLVPAVRSQTRPPSPGIADELQQATRDGRAVGLHDESVQLAAAGGGLEVYRRR